MQGPATEGPANSWASLQDLIELASSVLFGFKRHMPDALGRVGDPANCAPRLFVVRNDELVHAGRHDVAPVSYTHLTLPTIYSV